jgi:hypothetical protein
VGDPDRQPMTGTGTDGENVGGGPGRAG